MGRVSLKRTFPFMVIGAAGELLTLNHNTEFGFLTQQYKFTVIIYQLH